MATGKLIVLAEFDSSDDGELVPALAADCFLRVDLKTLMVTALPLSALTDSERLLMNGGMKRGGKENWND